MSILFREAFSHPYISFFHLLVNGFSFIGKLIATALVQGGQPPVYFAGAVADFIVFSTVKTESILMILVIMM